MCVWTENLLLSPHLYKLVIKIGLFPSPPARRVPFRPPALEQLGRLFLAKLVDSEILFPSSLLGVAEGLGLGNSFSRDTLFACELFKLARVDLGLPIHVGIVGEVKRISQFSHLPRLVQQLLFFEMLPQRLRKLHAIINRNHFRLLILPSGTQNA